MTGPAGDIFKQTIAGYDIAALLRLMPKAKRAAGEEILKRIWTSHAGHVAATRAVIRGRDSVIEAFAHEAPPAPGALPEIRHTDKIEVKAFAEGFAETSETTWQRLKQELFQAGVDEFDVRRIAKSLAKGEAAGHGGEIPPFFEYRKAQP